MTVTVDHTNLFQRLDDIKDLYFAISGGDGSDTKREFLATKLIWDIDALVHKTEKVYYNKVIRNTSVSSMKRTCDIAIRDAHITLETFAPLMILHSLAMRENATPNLVQLSQEVQNR
jgi:hypothetical protein